MADKMSSNHRDITTVELRPRDLKRIRLIKVKRDFANNPAVITAALDALEKAARKEKTKAVTA